MGARLAHAGVAGASEAAQRLVGRGMITRMHFARHIVDCGRARSIKAVFEQFLTPGKPGYVPTEWAEPADAIDWIRQAGGVAVLAHPQRYKISATARHRLVEEFKECGGTAIEVVAGNGNAPAIQSNAQDARRFRLAASVGSDFHSPEHFWLKLGDLPSLPSDLIPVWDVW
jgi:predicted metal-dependent phosphoesterase TrpH